MPGPLPAVERAAQQPGADDDDSTPEARHGNGHGIKDYGHGLWFLVVVKTAVVLLFAASVLRPTSECGRSDSCSAFVTALIPLLRPDVATRRWGPIAALSGAD